MTELRQLTPLDLEPDLTPRAFEELLLPLQDGTRDKVALETRHLRKDGTYYPVEVHLHSMNFRSAPAFLAIMIDTTERRSVRLELERRESTIHSLFEGAAQGIFAVSAQGRIVMANQVCQRMFGYSHEELVQRPLESLIPGLGDEGHIAAFSARSDGAHPAHIVKNLELNGRRMDGSQFLVDLRLSRVEAPNQDLTLVFVSDHRPENEFRSRTALASIS